jgi:primosomal protein N' (replication factor Y)
LGVVDVAENAGAGTDERAPLGAPPGVRVLPDVPAIDKEFDYLVPDGVEVSVGDVVRVELHGRRVGGWVVAVDVAPEPGVTRKPLAKVSGRGPSADLIDLAGWAAWRWAGRRASFLRTAAPPGVVRSLPVVDAGRVSPAGADRGPALPVWVPDALAPDRAVLRLAPGADRYPLVRAAVDAAAAAGGAALVLCPSVTEAEALGRRLRRSGTTTAVITHAGGSSRAGAGEWALAAAGATAVIGARAAAWAPVPALRRVLVLDEHDESYQQEQAPTWHARDVAVERAHRAGAPALLASPCPTLEALGWGTLVTTDRATERSGWARVEVVDQRQVDPALGPLFSPRLVDLVRGSGRVVCVLNRTGRARLLACGACDTMARCGTCDGAVADEGSGRFTCTRCGTERPAVCLACGGSRFRNLRLGVSRAREELEALAGEPVAEVTATTDDGADTRVVIGTEAVLHRVARTDHVAFLDFDQELLVPRYRSVEQALALLARAARLVERANAPDGRLLVQTRSPDHPVLVAARLADPARLADSEGPLRAALGFPPTVAMAVVSGEAAPAFMDAFGRPADVRIQGPVDGAWRLVAPDHRVLCDALAATPRPPGRLRIEVDPLRI